MDVTQEIGDQIDQQVARGWGKKWNPRRVDPQHQAVINLYKLFCDRATESGAMISIYINGRSQVCFRVWHTVGGEMIFEKRTNPDYRQWHLNREEIYRELEAILGAVEVEAKVSSLPPENWREELTS